MASDRIITRRVRGKRGIVVVRYNVTRQRGTFAMAEGPCTMVGSWGYVAQHARAVGVPDGGGK